MQAQSELEQIADSLEPINLDWLAMVIALTVLVAQSFLPD
jgi:hypothetical protein